MIIDEIINLLSNESASRQEALLKTKVLLHQIGKKELVSWVNHELNGYPPTAKIPEYRKLNGQILANLSSMTMRHLAQPLPTLNLEKKLKKLWEEFNLTQSLAILEAFTKGNGAALTKPIPLEANTLLSEKLQNGWFIENAWTQIPIESVKGVLAQVRSRLLDFILELKDQLGDASTEVQIKQKVAELDTTKLFNNAVFGSGTVIVIGNNNVSSSNISIETGNYESLLKDLKDLDLPVEAIVDLKVALESDREKQLTNPFEGKTGQWFTDLIRDSAKGFLGKGTEVLSAGLAKALLKFYGLST